MSGSPAVKGSTGMVLSLEPLEPRVVASSLKMPRRVAWCRVSIFLCGSYCAEAMNSGVLAYPAVDVKATLTFGSYHDVDSEMAFCMAAIPGLKRAPQSGSAILSR